MWSHLEIVGYVALLVLLGYSVYPFFRKFIVVVTAFDKDMSVDE
jgi:hypothetical protein